MHPHTEVSEADLTRLINPVVRGWMYCYGAFCQSALYPLLGCVNSCLMRWIRKKYKRRRGREEAQKAWNRTVTQRPRSFAHWAWVPTVPVVW
ncbi:MULTISPECIES: group II intron maturase-specific domain-containing protein [unclassified Streptomyces]|uniref:group II intron maturase-specific domain-containing protein n=1 Tax=unclassified Streptomyces TaxID=2593676 RepID=UPI0033C0EE0A